MATDFKLPELGENIESGDVVRVMVSAGERIERDQPVLELETDKATIEVPSSIAGVIQELKVKAGDRVKVGQPILTVNGDEKGDGTQHRSEASDTEKVPEGGLQQHVGQPDEPTKAEKPPGPPSRDQAPSSESPSPRPRRGEVVDISRAPRAASEVENPPPEAEPAAPAAPSVRRMARELGVEIDQVPGSGPAGRISGDDVKSYARWIISNAAGERRSQEQRTAPPLPDFSKWGEIERRPMSSVRRKTAERVSLAWTTIPHVTQHDVADATDLERLRRRFGKKVEEAGGKLTITAIMLKVIASALREFPQFNASVDIDHEGVVYKKYVHIGVAVDTDRGLLVPVIRDVDGKSILQLSRELSEAADKARNKKLTLDEMQGGSFTITNLGGLGGQYFSPIINAPEVAILGISRATVQPVFAGDHSSSPGTAVNGKPPDVTGGSFQPRLILPLSLSYDHRVIDGADAIRFLRWVIDAIEQPFLLSLHG